MQQTRLRHSVYSRRFGKPLPSEDSSMRKSIGIILILILVGATLLLAKVQRPFDTWRQSGGGGDSSQYSSLKQINKNNVKQLEVAWTYPTGPGTNRFDPLINDGVMYVLAQNNSV